MLGFGTPGAAETLRLAYLQTELGGTGPGRQLQRLGDGDHAETEAVLAALALVGPDILLLGGIDHDPDGHTLRAVGRALARHGLSLPHAQAPRPNSGLASGRDLDGDGTLRGPEDAQGYGRYPGASGLALLSRWPIALRADLTATLWREMPGADPPRHPDGAIFPSEAAWQVQRLPAVAHWVAAIATPSGTFEVLALAAAPPVFDGPEDRNGRRNADELTLAAQQVTQRTAPGTPPLSVLGTLNVDPADGDARTRARRALLAHPGLQDPEPRSADGTARSARDGGVNRDHRGDPALDTGDFRDTGRFAAGNLRLDYVLPDARLEVIGAGLHWPETGRRAVVWVDLRWPPP